jgi:hypothetical protein
MAHDKIGPKEAMLRAQREARAEQAERDKKAALPELRAKVAEIKPKPKKAKKPR